MYCFKKYFSRFLYKNIFLPVVKFSADNWFLLSAKNKNSLFITGESLIVALAQYVQFTLPVLAFNETTYPEKQA